MNKVILVDQQDSPIGSADKLAAHQQGLLHRAFSVFILRQKNNQLEILLQQRQITKYHAGGLWTNTCCSHPQPEETTKAAAHRRLQEELGFIVPLTEIGVFTYRAEFPNGLIEHEVDHVLIGYFNSQSEVILNPDEVMNIRWISLDDAAKDYQKNPEKYTPWFAQALEMLKTFLQKKIYTASAPGSLMLTGEHAVLHGYPALVCAVDQRIKVQITPRKDDQIIIHSALGQYQTHLQNITITAPFEFVLTAIKQYQQNFNSGFDLNILSDFSHKVGLGSSAAATVATLAALAQWLNPTVSLMDLYQQAYKVILSVQKVGSGADVAASVFGGIILYQQGNFVCKKLGATFPLVLIYSGSKQPTVKVIAHVEKLAAKQPEIYQKIFFDLGQCTLAAEAAINAENYLQLGEVFNRHQQLQMALGVSNAMIENIIEALLLQPSISGAKISGSGLGDCVIAVGTLPNKLFPHNVNEENQGVLQLPVNISTLGVDYAP